MIQIKYYLDTGWQVSLNLGFWRGIVNLTFETRFLLEPEPDTQHALFLCLAHPWLIPWFKLNPWFRYIDEWVEVAQVHNLSQIEDVRSHLPYEYDPIPF